MSKEIPAEIFYSEEGIWAIAYNPGRPFIDEGMIYVEIYTSEPETFKGYEMYAASIEVPVKNKDKLYTEFVHTSNVDRVSEVRFEYIGEM